MRRCFTAVAKQGWVAAAQCDVAEVCDATGDAMKCLAQG
jgi:hypothetical protein